MGSCGLEWTLGVKVLRHSNPRLTNRADQKKKHKHHIGVKNLAHGTPVWEWIDVGVVKL